MSDYAGNKMEYSEGGGSQLQAKAGLQRLSELEALVREKERTDLQKSISANQKEIAEAQQKIAEANKAALATQFPTGTIKPLESTIATDDKFGYFAELITYKAFSKKIEELTGKVKKLLLSNPKILIVDSMDIAAGDADLLQIKNQLEYFLRAIPEEIQKTESLLKLAAGDMREIKLTSSEWGAGFGAFASLVPGIVSAAADVMGYFQPNYDIKGHPVTLENTALQAMMARDLAATGISVFFPNLHRISSTPSLDKLKDCLTQRIELSLANAALKTTKVAGILAERKKLEEEIAALDSEIKKLKSPDDNAKIEEKKKELEAKKIELAGKVATAEEQQVARNEALIISFDTFHSAMTTVASGKTYSPLAAAAMQEYYLDKNISHLLYISTTSAGGEAILERRLIGRRGITYTGGGVITCILVETSGNVVFSTSEVACASAAYNFDNPKPQEYYF